LSQIDWKYLAGFFDGEGHIHIPNGGKNDRCVRIEFSQSEPRLFILALIQKFLDSHGISSKKYVYGGHGTVKVFKHEDAVKLLEHIAPKLILKRDDALKALTLLKSRPRRTNKRCKRGHLWSKHAVYDKNGVRQCGRCKTEWMRRHRALKVGG
jgi:hypothetical protein